MVLERRSRELARLFAEVDREDTSTGTAITPASGLLQQAIRASKEMQSIADEFKKLKIELPDQNDAPIGCVTVDARRVSAASADLVGVPLGLRTREWFDIDKSQPMRYSAEARDGAGTVPNLRPNTTYYFRYVVQHNDTTCFGETKSFTTPPR